MENTLDLVEEGAISRAKSYMSIVLLAPIPDSRPYCVGMYSVTKGTDSFALSTAHREVVNAVKEAGLHVVTLPGGGDVTLRSLQWGFYTCQRYNWFTKLIVPLDLFYDFNGEYPIFGLQDPFHVLKQLRNNVKRLETRCLSLGKDKTMEKESMIRWDLVYDLFELHKEVMLHSSLSAVNVTDKQDPSLVIDISRLYELFLFHGYTALGLFFKATHFIAEAFLDKELDPLYERVYKVWWAKTFFSTWGTNSSYKGQHITDQTFKDMICACDDMILYITLLIKKYPDSVLTTELLGSDQNEQLFAFIRTSYAGGRSRNLDAATLAFGTEKKNVRSELSLPDDRSVVAHTRERTLMRPTVPSPAVKKSSISVKNTSEQDPIVWTGKMVEIHELVKSMNKGSKDCIQEEKQYRFPVFLRELDPEERTGKRIEDIDSIDECCYEHDEEELEEEPPSVDFDDQDDSNTISTKLYGTLNFKTAENLLLNGGRSTISAKSRRSRFEGDAFGISSDIKLYLQPDCECTGSTHVKIGDIITLSEVLPLKKQPKKVTGEVRYISYKNCPLTFFCPKHSLVAGIPNIWVYNKNEYIRCSFN